MDSSKRVIVVGGTGFLGYHAIQEFLKNGWGVTALGLPPEPPPNLYPTAVKIILQNLEALSDEELLTILRGHDVLVFAAGLDDRVTPRRPAYPKYYHANVEVPVKLLTLAKQAGVARAVVLGSYFAHFNRLWPDLKLAERHPYIRSRVEQEKAVMSIPGMDVDVLELPYIFGSMPVRGWKPLWTPLVKYIRSTNTLFYMNGGTTCITAETVGQAVYGAVERGHASTCYPIGGENLTWAEMLTRLAAADGCQVRVVTLPTFLVKFGLMIVWLFDWLKGKESGLDYLHFASLQTANTFIDPEPSSRALGYDPGGLDGAFRKTVEACRE
jgi:dihydroflavonol-4-reductase